MAGKREHMLSVLFAKFADADDARSTFIDICDEGQLLQNSTISDVVSFVNTCLNTGHRRKDGADLLCSVLKQCESEVFQQHAETWVKLLLQGLQSHDDFEVQQATCRATERLLYASTAFPELVRAFSVNIIPFLVAQLLTFPDKWRNLTLRMLITCMDTYPGPCGSGGLRLKMEQAVQRCFLESDLACQAYSYLPQCGGAGNLSMKYTTAWSTSFNKLLATISECLDELYHSYEVTPEKYEDANPLIFPEIPETEPARTITLSNQMKSLCTALVHMLRPNFPAPVQIDLKAVLEMICRVMAISPDFLLTKQSEDRIRLAAFIPSVHIATLGVLDALVTFTGTAMIPFASKVNQIYSQTSMWIRKLQPASKYGTLSPYAGIERALWTSIITWLETLGGSSGVEDIAEDLIGAFAKIATPVLDVVPSDSTSSKLAEVSDMFHRRKGKGKKRLQNEQLSSQRKLDYTADWELVTTVWQATSLIVQNVGAFMVSSHYQAIHNVIFTVLSPVQPPIPYHHPKCLSAVYSTLLTCITSPHPSWPAPVQIATELFARNVHIPLVAKVCTEGLSVCENIMHPRAPSLQMPLDIDEFTTQKAEKNVSEQPQQLYFIPSGASESINGLNKNGDTNTEAEEMEEEDATEEELMLTGIDEFTTQKAEKNVSEQPQQLYFIPSGASESTNGPNKNADTNTEANNGDKDKDEKELLEDTSGVTSENENITGENGQGEQIEETKINTALKRKPNSDEEKPVKQAKMEEEDTTEEELMLSDFLK